MFRCLKFEISLYLFVVKIELEQVNEQKKKPQTC